MRGHSQMAVPRHSQTGRDCAGSRTPGGRAMLGPEQRSTQLKPPVHYAFLNTHTRVHTHTHTRIQGVQLLKTGIPLTCQALCVPNTEL